MGTYAEDLLLERIAQIRTEIKNLQVELKQLELQRGNRFQSAFPIVEKDDCMQKERIAALEGQNFQPPAKLARQLGWAKHDLLLFTLDKHQNLTIQKPNLPEPGYTMILDDALHSFVPFEILKLIYPKLSKEDLWMLPDVEFYTEIKGRALLIRHK